MKGDLHGEEAIALALRHAADAKEHSYPPISALLLDLYMPGLSGWETLQQLKRDPATNAIRFRKPLFRNTKLFRPSRA